MTFRDFNSKYTDSFYEPENYDVEILSNLIADLDCAYRVFGLILPL